jgi:hypothetical protein
MEFTSKENTALKNNTYIAFYQSWQLCTSEMLAMQHGLCEQIAMKWNLHLEHTSYSNSLSEQHTSLQDDAMPKQLPPQKSE